MTNELKSIVAGLVPHVRDALQAYTDAAANAESTLDRMLALARLSGYLRGARNSGHLLPKHCDYLLEEINKSGGYLLISACFAPPITDGERSLYRWQYKIASGFEKILWSAIIAADSTNLAYIEKGFPSHVAAYRRFANEAGWWDRLVARIDRESP